MCAKASKWHRVTGYKEETRKKKKVSKQESCESWAKESELYSVANEEPRRASERENNMIVVTDTDYA